MEKNNFLVIILGLIGVALCCAGHVIVVLGMSSIAAFLTAIWFDYQGVFISLGLFLMAVAVYLWQKKQKAKNNCINNST